MSAAMMATQGNTERDDTVTIDGRRYRLNVPPSEQDDVRMITRRLSQAASRRGFNVHAVTFTKEELGFFARIYLRLYQVPGTNQKRLDLWFHAHPNERRDWDMDAFFNTVVFDEQNGSKPRRKPGIPWERQPAVPQQVGQSQQPAASLSSDDNGDNEGGDKEGDKEDGEPQQVDQNAEPPSEALDASPSVRGVPAAEEQAAKVVQPQSSSASATAEVSQSPETNIHGSVNLDRLNYHLSSAKTLIRPFEHRDQEFPHANAEVWKEDISQIKAAVVHLDDAMRLVTEAYPCCPGVVASEPLDVADATRNAAQRGTKRAHEVESVVEADQHRRQQRFRISQLRIISQTALSLLAAEHDNGSPRHAANQAAPTPPLAPDLSRDQGAEPARSSTAVNTAETKMNPRHEAAQLGQQKAGDTPPSFDLHRVAAISSAASQVTRGSSTRAAPSSSLHPTTQHYTPPDPNRGYLNAFIAVDAELRAAPIPQPRQPTTHTSTAARRLDRFGRPVSVTATAVTAAGTLTGGAPSRIVRSSGLARFAQDSNIGGERAAANTTEPARGRRLRGVQLPPSVLETEERDVEGGDAE